ncbi:Leucine-rich repeat receptor-like protein FASCIATED EAR2 [Ananas comosus]|uniref:Leucine-rich repeat receptor-like protein FASCIATED EAR2 n=1 Tax=Ananas comosus TaxID=4615 RepID=A0A199V282_ANACO|nr:Leucine-rich repeat receptor-like protein FASCIATED EAR2 [Ananas comosus]
MATLILSLLLWILANNTIVASGCMEIERNALLTFKAGLVDPQNLLSSWERKDCCKWRGVVCSNTTGHVMKLNLRGSYDMLSEEWLCLSVSLSLDIKGEELTIWRILYLFESIDLSDNNLSGEIPDEITDLHTLQYLNLSRNNLIGHISEQIGEMQSLESLDLAMNKLSDNIPQSLSALTYLEYLNLSYNNLSGVIPTGNQLQTLDDPSIYIGNPYLCGPPSTRNCSANEINYKDNEGPKDNSHEDLLLIVNYSVVSLVPLSPNTEYMDFTENHPSGLHCHSTLAGSCSILRLVTLA